MTEKKNPIVYYSLKKITSYLGGSEDCYQFLLDLLDASSKKQRFYKKILPDGEIIDVPILMFSKTKGTVIGVCRDLFVILLSENKEKFLSRGCSKRAINSLIINEDVKDIEHDQLIELNLLVKKVFPKTNQRKVISYIKENCFADLFVEDDKKGFFNKKPMFVYQKSDGESERSFYLRKEAYVEFINRYQNKILALFGMKRIMYPLSEDKFVFKNSHLTEYNPEKEEYILLWDLAKKFCLNSICCSEFSQYIENSFLETRFIDKNSQDAAETSMFAYRRLKNGVIRYYFKKNALTEFKKRYSDCLKAKAKELDERSDLLDLRTFSRMMSKKGLQSDKLLREFILKNCLDERVLITDARGREQRMLIFQRVSDRYVYIRKKAIPLFIKKYGSELKKMGFLYTEYQAENTKKISRNQEYCQFLKFVDQVKLPLKNIKKFKKFILKLIDEAQQNNDADLLEKKIFIAMDSNLFVKKELIPAFTMKYEADLLNFGVDADYLMTLNGKKDYSKRTPEMVSIHAFFKLLKVPQYAYYNKLFADVYLKDATKQIVNIDGNEEPVFKKALYNSKGYYFFKNDCVMKEFILKNKEILIDKFGVFPVRIDLVLGQKNLLAADDNMLFVSSLTKILHKKYLLRAIDIERFKDLTYPSLNEKGEIEHKKMFHLCISDKGTKPAWMIDKEAVKYFALQYKEELNLSPAIVDELWGKKRDFVQNKEWMSIQTLCYVLGKNPSTQKRKITIRFIDKFYNLIQDKYKNFKFLNELSDGSKKEELLFKPNKTRLGNTSWSIHCFGISQFIKMAKNDLIALGFKAELLIDSEKELSKKVQNYQNNSRLSYLNRLKKFRDSQNQKM